MGVCAVFVSKRKLFAHINIQLMQNAVESSYGRTICLTCLKNLVMTHFICVLCPNREERCGITMDQWEEKR